MAMRHVKISLFVDDVRSGMTDFELMEKHSLSMRQLQSVFDRLLAAGTLDPIDLEGIDPESEPTAKLTSPCPSCGRPMLSLAETCPGCGLGNPITEIKELMFLEEDMEAPPLESVFESDQAGFAELMDLEEPSETFVPEGMDEEAPEAIQSPSVQSPPFAFHDFRSPAEARPPGLLERLLADRTALIGLSMVGAALIVLLIGLYVGTLISPSPRIASPVLETAKPPPAHIATDVAEETLPPVKPSLTDARDSAVSQTAPDPEPSATRTERIEAAPEASSPVAAPSAQDPGPSRTDVLMDRSASTTKGLVGEPAPHAPPDGLHRTTLPVSLEEAVRSGESVLVRALLEKSGELNEATSEGETLLTLAARQGSDEVVALLLRRGADPTLRNKAGRTALDITLEKGHVAALRALVAHTKDKAGAKLLEACRKDSEQIAKFLIAGGANVNARDDMGNTPLMLAVGMGKIRLVRALLEEGADVNATNNKGISVLGWAYSPVIEGEFSVRQRRQIVKLLKDYGATPGRASWAR